jgi:hypothetical protein
MGNRIVLSGTQLGMLAGTLKAIKPILKTVIDYDLVRSVEAGNIQELLRSVELGLEDIKKYLNDQTIFDSENLLEDDINDLKNLSASWFTPKKIVNTEYPEEKFDHYYTLYWRDGKREIVKGKNLTEALTFAGYGGGAFKALDFHTLGVNDEYEWDKDKHDWVKKQS